MISFESLTGKACTHIVRGSMEQPIHKELVAPICELKQAAAQEGFDLRIASGFRSYERQLGIWNAKASGQRELLDSDGLPLNYQALGREELLFAILRWSAVPGASRHHWGTDIDIYDASAMDDQYQLQLTVQETQSGGIFERFYIWLDDFLDKQRRSGKLGFYRPYNVDRGGVSPEPWHLSYAPLAKEFANHLTEQALLQLIQHSDICLKNELITHFSDVYHRFIVVE